MGKPEFMHSLQIELVPHLEEQGFSGHARAWKRIREPFVDCVQIQTRSDNQACCINLGEHLTFLPQPGSSEVPDLERIMPVDCEIQKRLAPPGVTDYWWAFDKGEAEAIELVDCFKEYSESFFAMYINFPMLFRDIELTEIESSTTLELLPTMTKVRRILLLARIHDYLGEGGRAIAWAQLGYDNSGMASGPKAAFRKIIRKYSL